MVPRAGSNSRIEVQSEGPDGAIEDTAFVSGEGANDGHVLFPLPFEAADCGLDGGKEATRMARPHPSDRSDSEGRRADEFLAPRGGIGTAVPGKKFSSEPLRSLGPTCC